MKPIELFSAVVGAFVHDVGHTGVNNNFLVQTGSQLALRFNDQSPLENMHVAIAFEAMKDRYVVFLANHGMLAGAKDLPNAFGKAEEIKLCAEIYYRAKSIGEPKVLPKEETDNLKRLFGSYGQVKTN